MRHQRRSRRRTRRRIHCRTHHRAWSARAARAGSCPARAPREPRPAARWWGSVRRSRSPAGAAVPPPVESARVPRAPWPGSSRRAPLRSAYLVAPTGPRGGDAGGDGGSAAGIRWIGTTRSRLGGPGIRGAGRTTRVGVGVPGPGSVVDRWIEVDRPPPSGSGTDDSVAGIGLFVAAAAPGSATTGSASARRGSATTGSATTGDGAVVAGESGAMSAMSAGDSGSTAAGSTAAGSTAAGSTRARQRARPRHRRSAESGPDVVASRAGWGRSTAPEPRPAARPCAGSGSR